MDWRQVGFGVILGCAIGFSVTRIAWNIDNQPGDNARQWALPDFQYNDVKLAGWESIYITGTLMGSNVGYPVNTWNLQCVRSENVCHVASVDEIGRDQLGTIDSSDWPIVTWSDTTIVAQTDPTDTTSCGRATITINRDAKSVTYTGIQQNRDKSYCHMFKDDKPTDEWKIGDPPKPWDKKA